jgi:hypothetical protein
MPFQVFGFELARTTRDDDRSQIRLRGSDPNGARITDTIGLYELSANHTASMFYAWI